MSDLLTPAEAGTYLGGLTAHTLAQWRSTGRYQLRFVKVGRWVRYRKADLDDFIERRTYTVSG